VVMTTSLSTTASRADATALTGRPNRADISLA
jgi:hypothetical protein